MSIEGQSHFLTVFFLQVLYVLCFYKAQISGERLQDIGPLFLNMKPPKGKKKVTCSFLDLCLRSLTSKILGSAWWLRSRPPDSEV